MRALIVLAVLGWIMSQPWTALFGYFVVIAIVIGLIPLFTGRKVI